MDEQLLADLAAEYEALDRLVAPLDDDGWATPTSAVGWCLADQISHLTMGDQLGAASLRGEEIPKLESDPVFEALSARPPAEELLAAWRSARRDLLEVAARVDSRTQVDWVVTTMSARTLVTTRLTECWAHSLDCFEALGVAPVDTARLRHVVHQSFRVLPYAFTVSGRTPPGHVDTLALDLTGPGGERWWHGPERASSVVTGSASEWCRVAVHRVPRRDTSLAASDELADAALDVVRTWV